MIHFFHDDVDNYIEDYYDCDDEDDCTADSYDGAECRNEPLPDGDADGVCDLIDGCRCDNFGNLSGFHSHPPPLVGSSIIGGRDFVLCIR